MNKEYKNTSDCYDKEKINSLIFIKYMPLHNKNPSKLFLYLARKLYVMHPHSYNTDYIITEFRINVNTINDYEIEYDKNKYIWINSICSIFLSFEQHCRQFAKHVLCFDHNDYKLTNSLTLNLMLKYLSDNEKIIVRQLYTDERCIELLKNKNISIIAHA